MARSNLLLFKELYSWPSATCHLSRIRFLWCSVTCGKIKPSTPQQPHLPGPPQPLINLPLLNNHISPILPSCVSLDPWPLDRGMTHFWPNLSFHSQLSLMTALSTMAPNSRSTHYSANTLNANFDPLAVRSQLYPVPVNHSCSCIQLLNGDLFYLPNCQWDVIAPEYTEDPYWMIFKLREVKYEQFLKPRWFTKRAGFLFFLSLWPIDTGYPFDRLPGMPTLYENPDRKFIMSDEHCAAWSRLELNLIWSTANLRDHLDFFNDCPFQAV